jgi:ankyrin repeat protein
MPDLPARADLDQLRRQAKDLLRAARRGDETAVRSLAGVAGSMTLATAQLAVARSYGFASWAALKTEVERRRILDARDVDGLRALLARQPGLAWQRMQHWCDHSSTGELARMLIAAGAPVDGLPGDAETPLITAASYGDAEVAAVLIAEGADREAVSADTGGGVPGGTALRHAAVFGMTDVAAVLTAAGARDLVHAAASGSLGGWPLAELPEGDRVAALRIAAEHGHLAVIDQLIAAGTPVDGLDRDDSTALHEAAYSGQVDAVRHLLARGADPALCDTRFGATPLGWCEHRHGEVGPSDAHEEIERILGPVTPASQ